MAEGRPRLLRASVRVYRVLLRAYPAGFRRRNGEEMARFFRDRARDALEERGAPGLVAHWLAALRDLAVNAVAERRRVGRRSSSEHAPPASDGTRRGTGRRRGGGMDAWVKDLRHGVRSLLKAPGFTAVAVVTVALGIGANTAIFSVVRGVLLRPLPYEEPDRLVIVWGRMTNRGVEHFPHSPPDLRDYQRKTTTFEGLTGIFAVGQPLTGDFEPVQVNVGGVTEGFFEVLGVDPLLGRSFASHEFEPVDPALEPGDPGFANNAAVLDHALWQQRFGGDPGVLGRIVDLGGTPAEIVGVMPPDFELLLPPTSSTDTDVDVWVANRIDFANAPRGNVFLQVLGRLEAGASLTAARTEMDRIAADLRETLPVWETSGFEIEVMPLHAELTEHVRPVLWALMGAVVFVLLIACANVSNLLLVRATRRERELAVRAAMGGSRLRLVRQLLGESLLLALGGALLGLVLARGGIRLLLAFRPEDLPRIDTVAIDGTVLAFTAAAGVGAALVFGVLPALRASRPDLAESLKDRGRTASTGSQRALRNAVVVTEVALSLVLLLGAGLMVRSFAALQRIDPGFEPEGVLTFKVSLPFARYPEASDRAAFQDRLQERLEGLPGVRSASGALPLPLTGRAFNGRWGKEEALDDPEAFRQADYRAVLPDYFRTLATRLLEGRTFTRADNADSAAVVMVDRRLAEIAFPGESAVGKRILTRVVSPEAEWVEIVGVVEGQRHASLMEEPRETVYFPDRYVGAIGLLTWAVRADVPPMSLVDAVKNEVEAVDPLVPVSELRPLEAYVSRAMAPTRFALTLIAIFGAIALVMATVGLYGVLSYVVRQRTGEIGVRMAFGAERGSILRLVVGQGMAVTLVGVGLGLVAALALTRLMASLLVEVEPTDPLTFVAVSALFLTVAMVACTVPALRATRVDPAEALRNE